MKSTLVEQPEEIAISVRGEGQAAVKARTKEATQTKSSSLVLVGASFKTSSLSFREALARRLSRSSERLPRLPGVKEYAQLVTCNRIEILMATDSPDEAERAFLDWVSSTRGMGRDTVYVRRDTGAIAHLFRVSSGLDSMVLGEEQILTQVKEAGVAARTSKSSRGTLSALFDASVNVGRRARAGLKEADDSVSSIAIQFAMERLARPPRSVLLIGTGKTTRLAATQLEGARLYVATRRSSVSSFPNATIVSHKDLKRVASKCDLIISATKHQGYVLKKGDLSTGRRVVLDLAFPRNIDPGLRDERSEVYNLEDLARVFTSRRVPPSPEARQAEELVFAEAESFSRWLLASRQTPALSQVYTWAESTRRTEADSALRRLPGLSDRERKVVEAMSKRLVSKLLAPPTSFAKSSSPDLPQDERLDLVQRIFEQGEK